MDTSLISDIKSLPQPMQEEVENFVAYLKAKLATKQFLEKDKNSKSNKRKAGFLKGTFVMADDFDEPLEDFKEYME